MVSIPSATVSMLSSMGLPITGTTEITAPLTRMGTVTTFVRKQPERSADIVNRTIKWGVFIRDV